MLCYVENKAIWDVFEYISEETFENVPYYKHSKMAELKNSRTEPSTEVEAQNFDKTDIDYYFIDRLEKMRDLGVKDEDYALIEQEETFSIERNADSFDEEIGYVSDCESSNSRSDINYFDEEVFKSDSKAPRRRKTNTNQLSSSKSKEK